MGDSPLKVHHLRPAPGAKTARPAWVVARGPRVRPPVVAPRAPRPATRFRQRFEGGQMPLHMRLPKLKGFKNPFRVEFQVVNLDQLRALYPEGGEVTVDDLVAKGAVRRASPVKVLGDRRPLGGAAGDGARLLGLRQGEDRRRRRHRHRAVGRPETAARQRGVPGARLLRICYGRCTPCTAFPWQRSGTGSPAER